MGADENGILSLIFLEKYVVKSISFGSDLVNPGNKTKSLKVIAIEAFLSLVLNIDLTTLPNF